MGVGRAGLLYAELSRADGVKGKAYQRRRNGWCLPTKLVLNCDLWASHRFCIASH